MSDSPMSDATVELLPPTSQSQGTDDENGYHQWEYPHGIVTIFEDGEIHWGRWSFDDPGKLVAAAQALLSAARKSAELQARR